MMHQFLFFYQHVQNRKFPRKHVSFYHFALLSEAGRAESGPLLYHGQ